MKKTLLVLVAIAAVSVVNAQTLFGVKGGLNFPNTLYSYSNGNQSDNIAVRFHFGGFAEVPLTEDFYIQPELMFNQYGGTQASETDIINMLSLPVLAKYKTGSISFYGGPQLDYQLSSQYKVTGTGSQNASYVFRKALLSGCSGAEYQLGNGLSIGVRYQRTLMNALSKDFRLPGYTTTFQAFALTASYTFGNDY